LEAGGGFAFASVKARVETSYSATTGHHSESSKSSSSTNTNERTVGSSFHESSDRSFSKTNQNTHEASKSKTKMSAAEVGSVESGATGGESTKGVTLTKSKETSRQVSEGGQIGVSDSNTVRENQEENSQQTNQNTQETSGSVNHLVGSEKVKTLQMAQSRDDSSTVSNTHTAEKSRTKTTHSSGSSGYERSGSKGQSGGSAQDRTFSTGFDWSRTSGHTWTKEKAYQVHMTVPAGVRSRLYQVVGYCDHFQLRTNNFRREDFVEPNISIEPRRADLVEYQ